MAYVTAAAMLDACAAAVSEAAGNIAGQSSIRRIFDLNPLPIDSLRKDDPVAPKSKPYRGCRAVSEADRQTLSPQTAGAALC